MDPGQGLNKLIILLAIAISIVIVYAYLNYPPYIDEPDSGGFNNVPGTGGGVGIGNYTPQGIHLSFIDDPSTTISISWVTVSRVGSPVAIIMDPQGINTTFEATIIEYGGYYWYNVRIRGLEPGVEYRYWVGDPVYGLSGPYTFRTARHDSRRLIFTVYGDHGVNKYSIMAVERALEHHPDLHLHTGDLSYGASNVKLWVRWLEIIEPLASTRPYMIAIGNHEYDSGLDLSDIKIYLDMPGSSFDYSFRWGNTYFITINLGPHDDGALSGDKYFWLEGELSRAREMAGIDWIIVFLHYPPYSSGATHGVSPIASSLTPLFDKYGVDLVFSGHEHNYERTYPIRGGAVVSRNKSMYIDPGGTIYIVAGGGGRSLYRDFIEPKPKWSVVRDARYSVVVVMVDGPTIKVKAIDSLNGAVFDEFTIIKGGESTGSAGPQSGLLTFLLYIPLEIVILFLGYHRD